MTESGLLDCDVLTTAYDVFQACMLCRHAWRYVLPADVGLLHYQRWLITACCHTVTLTGVVLVDLQAYLDMFAACLLQLQPGLQPEAAIAS
jgi:hypothetical protein